MLNDADRNPTTPPERYALVLAAGKSERFKSRRAKVLHSLCGKPILRHVLDTLRELDIKKTIVVIGQDADLVRETFSGDGIEFVEQKEQLGTGHAVQMAAPLLEGSKGNALVLCGDAPLVRASTLGKLCELVEDRGAAVSLLTADLEEPGGYGRIVRDTAGDFIDVVEEKDADEEQKRITEINAGFYCFRISTLQQSLPELQNRNQAGEYYLTDLPRIIASRGETVRALLSDWPEETFGINDRLQFANAAERLRTRVIRRWLREGVTMHDPSSVFIDSTVELSADVVLFPGVILEGATRIGSGSIIRAYSHLKDALLGEDVLIDHGSVVRESRIGSGTSVGPFAHIRQNAVLGSRVRVGNFVEVKKSTLSDEAKAAHLSYLGDSEIGARSNIGAGTITCNYDGVNKNKTVLEEDVFIGSNSQLVAPVTVHRGAYVAAGSTITQDVPPGSLAIARSRQTNKEGWKPASEKSDNSEEPQEG